MKIKKMTASFGALGNKTLELKDGLNVIYAPNESGKSTWCAFIRAMLYGVDSSQRERGGAKPDKLKYLPWSGAPMEGVMDLEHGGENITISRTTRAQNAPMRVFSAVYSGTGEAVPGLTGADAGERLTGVSRAVFERTVFISQGSLGISNDPELERRITSIVSTGEEDTSYTEADSRLREWQRRRRWNKRGLLPELEAGITATREKLDGLTSAAAERNELEDALRSAQAERNAVFAEVEDARKRQRKNALAEMTAARNELRELESAATAASDAERAAKDVLTGTIFGEKDPGSVREAALADAKQAELLGTREAGRILRPLGIALVAIALASIIAGLSLSITALAVAGGLILLAGIYAFLHDLKQRRALLLELDRRRSILEKYGASDTFELYSELESHKKAYEHYARAASEKRAADDTLKRAQEKQTEHDARLLGELDFASGNSEAALLTRKLASADGRLQSLRDRRAMAEGRLKTLGDPMVMESELISSRARLAELETQYDALELAITELREADTEMKNRFSPQLGKKATELMSRLTAGRYDQLTLDKELAAMTRREGDVAPRETAFLSAGAYDQLYLSVRLAIAELTMPEPSPLILDDALANFDEPRMAAALELIAEMSAGRQIILFTCHRRETDHLKGRSFANLITL